MTARIAGRDMLDILSAPSLSGGERTAPVKGRKHVFRVHSRPSHAVCGRTSRSRAIPRLRRLADRRGLDRAGAVRDHRRGRDARVRRTICPVPRRGRPGARAGPGDRGLREQLDRDRDPAHAGGTGRRRRRGAGRASLLQPAEPGGADRAFPRAGGRVRLAHHRLQRSGAYCHRHQRRDARRSVAAAHGDRGQGRHRQPWPSRRPAPRQRGGIRPAQRE